MSPQQLESIKEILLNPEEYEALENARIEVENAHLGGRAYIPGTPEAQYKDFVEQRVPAKNRAAGLLKEVKQEIAISKYPPKYSGNLSKGPRTFEQYRAYNASRAPAPKGWGEQTSLYAEAGTLGTIGAIFDLMLLSQLVLSEGVSVVVYSIDELLYPSDTPRARDIKKQSYLNTTKYIGGLLSNSGYHPWEYTNYLNTAVQIKDEILNDPQGAANDKTFWEAYLSNPELSKVPRAPVFQSEDSFNKL